MKFGDKIIVAAVLVAFLCSVASAGNVNPVTVTMEGVSVVGPAAGEHGEVTGELRGTVDSLQELNFWTNSPWHVEVREGLLLMKPRGASSFDTVDSFFDVFVELEVGDTTGENNVDMTIRDILTEISMVRQPPEWNPGNWDTGYVYRITLKYWLYSDDKVGNTYVEDSIIFGWKDDKWQQEHIFRIWSDGQAEIPEFPTVAVPVAAVIGLMFIFSRRSRYN